MGVLDLLRRKPAPQTAAVPMGAVIPGEDGWRDHLPGMGGRPEAAWRVWRDLGEIHFATTFMAREVGRVRFDVEIGDTMLDADKADEMVAAVTVPDGPGVQSAAMALHAQVAGEFLYARDADGAWHVLPVSTARKVDQTRGLEGFDVVVGWRRADPADPSKTDSPVLASLKVAHELLALTAASTTQARNRAAARGLLIRPKELEFPDGYDFNEEFERNLRAAMDGTAGGPLSQESPAEHVAGWKFLDMSTQFDAGLVERTEAAIRRLALAMDLEPGALLGWQDANHWCRPAGTLAFTRNGWAVPDVGDEILTVEGWSPVRAIYRADAAGSPGVRVTVSNMHGGPHHYPIVATEGHRWYVERDGQRFITLDPQPGDVVFRGVEQEGLPETPTLSDAMVELLALYSSDGTWSSNNQVRIAKGREWPFYARVLTELWGEPQDAMPYGADKPMWKIDEIRDNGVHVARLNKHARNEVLRLVPTKDKAIPLGVVRLMTADQLRLFLEAWRRGDGTDRGLLHLFQRAASRLDAPEYAAVMLGYGVRRWMTMSRGFVAGPMHNLRITADPVKVRKVERTVIEGEVWCPTTDAGTWLALDPATGWCDYTGNSAWASEESTIRAHVTPLAGVPAWVYARAIEQGAGLDRGLVTLTPDVAELLRRRPTIEDALRFWDRGLVSDEYARDAIDADAEDAGDGQIKLGPRGRVVTADESRQEPATAAVASDDLERLGDRLAAIDTRLLDTMVGATNVASVRAREKVGAKVRTALRGNAEASELIDGVDNADVTGVLPIEMWAPTVDAVEVVSAALTPLSDEWVKSVQGAFRSVARLGVEGVEPPDPQGDGEPDGWLRDATALFHAQMTDWVVNNLDRTRARSTVVPAEQIRRAMSVAGGNGDPLQLAAISGVDPIGVAIGRYVLRQLVAQGIRERPGQRRWHYGDPADRPTGPFPPHQEQDGRFVGIDGSSAGWFVGQHLGCRCQIVPGFERQGDSDVAA